MFFELITEPLKRIQRQRTKGWHMPDGAVYVGRPTKWGNPFTGDDSYLRYWRAVEILPHSENIMREWIVAGGDGEILRALWERDQAILGEIRGKDLACWCPLSDKNGNKVLCHADILLKIVNEI